MSTADLQCWRLDTDHQTWVFASTGGVPACIYQGRSLPQDESLEIFYNNQQRPLTGATLDRTAPLSLCPLEAEGFLGHPGLQLSDAQGQRLLPRFMLSETTVSDNGLIFCSRDDALGLQLVQHLNLDPASGLLVAASGLQHSHSQKPAVRVDWFSAPVFPVADHFNRLLDFAGRWCGEFQPQQRQWQLGIIQRESREGRTSHSHVPLLFCGETVSNNNRGEVCGWHFGWSGGHRMIAEELADGRRQVQFGAIDQTAMLDVSNPVLKTPPLYLAYSAQGLNAAMQAFHQYSRQQLIRFPHTDQPRPVHYNCWEAIYFDHDLDTLKAIAGHAAELGAERFVLDDGWFKGRDHDRAALGDWVVDREKYPHGLHPLIDHIQAQGMGFGLWVEPEMVNPDSDLYRAHPEWVLGPAHHPTGRQQLVLDLSQPAVPDYLFECLDALLAEYPIEYLKWDHNRALLGATAAQTEAFYQLLQRLRTAHPKVEIESCASGGGRIDFGVLAHTQRVWLSDSNDALERWRIQHEAALLLTPEVTGSHIGPRHCHTSGRVLPMEFRAWVAASRHMGFEMDPRELDAEERDTLTRITRWWQANRDWLFRGNLYRLDSQDEAVMAEMTVSHDGKQLVVFAAQMQTSDRNSTRLLRLSGLQADSFYRLTLHNPQQIAPNLTRFWNSPLAGEEGLVMSGQALMNQGISLPVAFPATMWVIEGVLTEVEH